MFKLCKFNLKNERNRLNYLFLKFKIIHFFFKISWSFLLLQLKYLQILSGKLKKKIFWLIFLIFKKN